VETTWKQISLAVWLELSRARQKAKSQAKPHVIVRL
jgi:hypothetical protein